MSVSLHVKLRDLHRSGNLELRRDPSRHYEGEGAYYFNGQPIKVEANVVGQNVENRDLVRILQENDLNFETSHDLAWCPALKSIVAYATSPSEEFLMSDRKAQIASLLAENDFEEPRQSRTRSNYAVV